MKKNNKYCNLCHKVTEVLLKFEKGKGEICHACYQAENIAIPKQNFAFW